MSNLNNSPKVDPRDVRVGVKLLNVLSNGSQIIVRVMEFIPSVQMWRVTDARNMSSDSYLIESNQTWACPLENLHYLPAPDFCCGPDEVVKAWHEERAAKQRALDQATLNQADFSPTPMSMYVMGMCSDAQHCLELGNVKMANQILNDIKLLIDQRLATKDEHGRHDFAPGEQNTRTQAKLEYLAKQRASRS